MIDFGSVYAKYFPFWGELSIADQEFLCRNSSEVHFEKEQLVHGNLGCSGLFIVKNGRLRLYMLSDEGKEITLYRLAPGEICMLSASCVLQSITFEVYVEAEMPSDCYMISASAFSEISEKVPAVKIYALETAVGRFSDIMWIMQQVVFMSMDKRLALFLLEGENRTEDNVIVMTHEQIARHLGTAREVVTKMLKRFANDGMIEVSRKGIKILDIKKLRGIAGESEESE